MTGTILHSFVLALAALLVLPAGAQTISPLTGTTAAAPADVSPASRTQREARPAAAGAKRQTMADRFTSANSTNDGRLTRDQAKVARWSRVANNFDTIDTGRKGYVTQDDVRSWARAQRAAARKPAVAQ